MTFREILNILWRRRLYIVATVVLAFIVAAVFLKTQSTSYSSETTVRLSAVGTTAAQTGQIGQTQVDFAIESIKLPAVLADAAKRSGDSSGSALAGQFSYDVEKGTLTNAITITALGPTAESAQARAKGVADAYGAYLQGQLDKALTSARAQQEQYTSDAQMYQAQLTQSPGNSLASSNLASAISNLGAVNTEINTITSSGPPLTVLTPAPLGARLGVGTVTALLIALVAGLIAGIAVALIRDQFDNRLRSEAELEKLTNSPSLGELNFDRRVARQRERLPAADRKPTALKENLRALRTTLQVLLPPTNGLVVFTSVEPGDGKTFVSANLALVWARTGKKVVLVGGDVRRPRLGEYYGEAADGAGLVELLTAASTSGVPTDDEVESFLRPTGFEGLRLLPSGAEPHAPSDLLATPALESILSSLRRMSDIVVVDSPPSMAIIDATLLAASADGAVMVASIGRTDRNHLTETVHSLESNGVPVLGIVANRSRRRMPKSYGSYYGVSAPEHEAEPAEESVTAGEFEELIAGGTVSRDAQDTDEREIAVDRAGVAETIEDPRPSRRADQAGKKGLA